MELDKQKLRAARLIAEGWHTFPAIAKKIGITRQQLLNWRSEPAFKAKVDDFKRIYAERVRSEFIASTDNRVKLLNQVARDLLKVKKERGEELKYVAGGSTGLLVRRYKSIGSGETAEKVEEFELDSVLLKELREHMTQVARELGQLDKASDADQQAERVVRVRPVKKKPNVPDA